MQNVRTSVVQRLGNATLAVEILLSVALIAISSKIRIDWQPVPFTLQTLSVMAVSLLLGPRKAIVAILAYLAAGTAGLPVFASEMPRLLFAMGTGGYLLSFIPAAAIFGLGKGRNSWVVFATLVLGELVVFTFGTLWLATFVGGIEKAISLGVLPFIFPEIMKISAVLTGRLSVDLYHAVRDK